MQSFEFDTIIIGSGLAGLSAAFHASRYGSVAIVTKSQLDTSNSYYAQGGIAAVMDKNDSSELHVQDTLVSGRGICDRDAVEILVTEGQERVKELIGLGMPFDRENDKIVLGLEGGHSKRRVLHAGGDATGKELTFFLLKLVKEKKNVQAFEHVAAVKLLQKNKRILGLHAYDFKTNQNVLFKAGAVILATGGLSRIYMRTTNPHTATGDGIALAYEAGARIADIEFVQFHPSALCLPNSEAYLISEAVRGEGAWLLNQKGERFMKGSHPLAELAPRDVVAYTIFRQIQESEQSHVWLSLQHLDEEKIKARFRNIYRHLHEFGFDMAKDLLPVAPAAHYMVGGVRTNLNGETNIAGLFACGEVASSGVMGANRLASNSLLECLVFGKRASEKAAQMQCSGVELPVAQPIIHNNEDEAIFLKYRNEMAVLMSQNLGIVRNTKSIEKALTRFEEIMSEFGEDEITYNKIKIREAAVVCRLIARGALIREESRGGHIREDFRTEDPDFRKHIIQQKDKEIAYEKIRE